MRVIVAFGVLTLLGSADRASAESPLAFTLGDGRMAISIDGQPFADYVWQDSQILRPYLSNVHAPGGIAISRRYPPREGQDATDHATMHPGVWLGFGDLSGTDFWRNKGVVRQLEFVERPSADAEGGSFVVKNRYLDHDQPICDELRRVEIRVVGEVGRRSGYFMIQRSQFTALRDFDFGDQEEMGFGIRMATPLTVKAGGAITNSEGLKNEKQVWGHQAAWCDYSGVVEGESLGAMVIPDPKNFRRCWFHVRDYGLMVANPFGVNALTGGPTSKIPVRQGSTFSLAFAILVHRGSIDFDVAYRDGLKLLEAGH